VVTVVTDGEGVRMSISRGRPVPENISGAPLASVTSVTTVTDASKCPRIAPYLAQRSGPRKYSRRVGGIGNHGNHGNRCLVLGLSIVDLQVATDHPLQIGEHTL
jgi:hypothetical protein